MKIHWPYIELGAQHKFKGFDDIPLKQDSFMSGYDKDIWEMKMILMAGRDHNEKLA